MMFFFDRDPLPGVDDAVDRFRKDEFESPCRSTVPLLSLLKHGHDIWMEIAGKLVADAEAADVHLEYTVMPPLVKRRRASHTDAMIVGSGQACAVEAKWTEPRYETVKEWLPRGNDHQNRLAVMAGWLSLLQQHATQPLEVSAFSGAVYQMVHRAASACSLGRSPVLAYLQFLPRPDDHPTDVVGPLNDLTQFHQLLGSPTGFPFYLVEVEARPLPDFERIKNLPKGSTQTAHVVRSALRNGPLFEFASWRLKKVSP